MLILAIDTTGFGVSLALVKDGQEVLMNKIGSGFVSDKEWSYSVHVLSKYHQRFLLRNLKKVDWQKIDAIAVSADSGIQTCILTGVSMAKTLASRYKKPLIKVDHLLAHIYSTWLERNPNDFQFPILVFSASGSHSSFSLLENKKACEIIYDAVPKESKGEIKVFMGLGKVFYYMGKNLGLISSTEASVGKLMAAIQKGYPFKYDFTKYYKASLLDLDFSQFVKSIEDFIQKNKKKSNQFICDIAASFQESISVILTDKIINLAKLKKVKGVHIVGGISDIDS